MKFKNYSEFKTLLYTTHILCMLITVKQETKMNKEEILAMFAQFEQASCTLGNVECWSARELFPLLGYTEWSNFAKVIGKAKEACGNVGHKVDDHFVGVNKMAIIGSGAERQVDDVMPQSVTCSCSVLLCQKTSQPKRV